MTRGHRPSIFRVGHVQDRGHTVTISGWGLGLCAAQCPCHRHPEGQHLTVVEDQGHGTLGLVQHWACDCCSPWTADELAAIVRDIADITALMETA